MMAAQHMHLCTGGTAISCCTAAAAASSHNTTPVAATLLLLHCLSAGAALAQGVLQRSEVHRKLGSAGHNTDKTRY
jgi:hypothetical protein